MYQRALQQLSLDVLVMIVTPESDDTTVAEETSSEKETTVQTDTPENSSLFVDYGIDGAGFAVELTQSALEEVARIRLETPSGEEVIEVRESITAYVFEILSDRAGVWSLTALTDNDDIIETVEVETIFEASVEEIGTLAELGITGKSSVYEQVHMQMTVINDGDVPLEPEQDRIELVVPGININVPTDGTATTEFSAEGEDDVIISGDDGVYTTANDSRVRAPFSLQTYDLPDRFDQDDLAGKSFQGQINIIYEGKRDDTIVPIDIIMGDLVELSATLVYYQGTEINKR